MNKLASYVFFILSCGLAWSQLKIDRKCLREKLIIFPELTTKNYVQLHPNETMDFPGITVCLRFYTEDASRSQSLFSLGTPSNFKDFAISWSPNIYQLNVHGAYVDFKGLPYYLNKWNSVCATWDASSGLGQMFVNEVPSVVKTLGLKEAFQGQPKIILGQHMSSYFHFSEGETFTGFISDVHVYKEVLKPRLIKNYMEAKIKYKLGDYINWHNLQHTIAGAAQVEEKQDVTFHTKQEQN